VWVGLNRGFVGDLAHRRDPLRNWSTDRPGNSWGVMLCCRLTREAPVRAEPHPTSPKIVLVLVLVLVVDL
jgi:hypothetical protein